MFKTTKALSGRICRKLENCKRLELDDEIKALLLKISVATMDRYLKKAHLLKKDARARGRVLY